MERRMIMPERGLRLDGSALLRLGALGGAPRRPRATPRFLAILAVAVSALAAERSLFSPKAEENPMKSKLSVLASAAIASSAFATDRLVPQQYPTIQAAVDASVHGDTITLAPGLYREAVELRKSVVLQGSPKSQPSEVVLTAVGVPGNALLLGFTGSAYNGPITIRNLTIDGESTAEPGEWAGMGVYPLGSANPLVIEDCIFRDLRNAFGDGGAIWTAHSPMTIRRCLFARNRSTVHGAAIYATNGKTPVVEDSVFVDHTFGTGTFYCAQAAIMTVRRSVVKNSNSLCANFDTGTIVFESNSGCGIGSVAGAGYVDGGGNNWNGPCPDCDGDGVIDLEEMLFNNGDCNGNGLLDACEIPNHPNWDRNNDGIIDSCQCIADITGNGSVDGVDLAAVLGSWGSGGGGKPGADIDGDGIVAGTDLAIVLGSWGTCP
jgi:predicted outer membrane repeat protein